MTFGQRAANWVAKTVGCWQIIIVQTLILSIWVALNITAFIRHWDPYPFILMNLLLSLQAAYTAPMIMMSQNQQAVKDRLEAHNDYIVNQKAEEKIRAVLNHLTAQDEALALIHKMLTETHTKMGINPSDYPSLNPTAESQGPAVD